MEAVKYLSLPTRYEIQETLDERFTKVRIYVMHDKLNLNNSWFDFEVIEKAKDSIKNIPILAFIKQNDGEESDFAGHEMELVIRNDELKFRYLGRPIGVIPADNNNYHYENINDKTYVVVDGYIWNDYANEALDILYRDGQKSQSMEIQVNDFVYSDEGYVIIKDYRYTGLCLLGDDVTPAMIGAKAELINYSFDNKFYQMIEELKNLLSSDKGGQVMEDNKDLKTEFALTNSQLRDEIRAELYKEYTLDPWGFKIYRYWYVDHTDSLVIAEDTEDGYRLVGFNYTLENDKVTIDFESKKRVRIMYEPIENSENNADDTQQLEFNITSKDKVEYDLKVKEKELEQTFSSQKEEEVNKVKQEFTSLEKKYNKLEQEVNELRQFKTDKLAEERAKAEQELYERFSAELTEEEIAEVKAVANEYTIEQLEEKLFTLVGKKKANFSKQPKKEKQSIKIELDVEDKPKYSKEWAHLIEQYAE